MINVLILDDEYRVFETLKNEVLKDEEIFNLRYAKNKTELFQILNNSEDDFLPHICLFDIELGDGKDSSNGIMVACEVLKKHKNMPIIFITNHHNEQYWDEVKKMGIPPAHFVSKGLTEDNLFTIKNPKHFIELIEESIVNKTSETQYLLLSNRKIGIVTDQAGTIPVEYDFYNKEDVLYIIGTDDIAHIYTAKSLNDKKELGHYILTTSAARVYKQLQRFYNCFLSCGKRGSIVFNAEKIKNLKMTGNEYSITFEGDIQLEAPNRGSYTKNDIVSKIKDKLKSEGMLLATKPSK